MKNTPTDGCSSGTKLNNDGGKIIDAGESTAGVCVFACFMHGL